jgi:uncharacterized protein YjiS (DUF1127 family)
MENINNATILHPVTQRRFRWVGLAIPGFVRRAWKAARSRRELVAMSDHLRADIGISRGEALFESRRKPWDLDTPRDPSRRSREGER